MPFDNFKLNDGNEIPAIAFGTGTALYGKDVTDNVEQAIESGFTHIDTAQIYANEEYVGSGIREAGLKREELYVTTKFGGGDIPGAIDTSLKKLGLKQVDLYLIHTPTLVEKNLEASWAAFEKIKNDGLSKSIGVSNFTVNQLKQLVKIAKIKPAVNQIRLHPYNFAENKSLLEYSAEHGIVTEAYSSLSPITKTPGGPIDPVLDTIGVRIGATPAQVIFKWLLSKGVVIVTTTSKKERLQEYLAVADLPDLTEADIAAIEEAGARGPPGQFRPKARAIAGQLLYVGLFAALWYGARFLLG